MQRTESMLFQDKRCSSRFRLGNVCLVAVALALSCYFLLPMASLFRPFRHSDPKTVLLTSNYLLKVTVAELQVGLSQGKYSSKDLVEAYLAQIERHNHDGLKLNAVLSLPSKSLLIETALALDAERKKGKLRGPLHGIPILVKDSIATHPDLGVETTAGSYAFKGTKPKAESTVVRQLREQGMIIIGKTNLSEFCNWKDFDAVPGWSAVGGQTYSAYINGGLDGVGGGGLFSHRSPGGSSTGSAVGVSAGFSPVAVGAETVGSLTQPAGRASLYALKPTVGLTSGEGVFQLSRALDVVGGMAKSVSDLALLTEVLIKPEERAKLPHSSYSSSLKRSFAGLKIGFLDFKSWKWPEKSLHISPDVMDQLLRDYEAAISKMREAGATVKYPVNLRPISELDDDGLDLTRLVQAYEFPSRIEEFITNYDKPPVHNLKELIKFNEEHADQELPTGHKGQTRLTYSRDLGKTEAWYESARDKMRRLGGREGIDKALKDQDLDVIGVLSDGLLSIIAAAAGYPLASAPLTYLDSNGCPFGFVFVAKAGQEDLLFRVLSAFEATFPSRKVPPLLENFS